MHPDHSDGSSTTVDRTLPLLSHATTPTAPPTEGTVASSLLRSHSVDEIHHLSVNQSSLPSTSRELPCIPRYTHFVHVHVHVHVQCMSEYQHSMQINTLPCVPVLCFVHIVCAGVRAIVASLCFQH